MNKEFIPYREALALKELGFDEPCFGRFKDSLDFQEGFYNTQIENTGWCIAPLYQQAFRLFREKYNFAITIQTYSKVFLENMVDIIPKQYNYHITNEIIYDEHYQEYYDTYEEAELACLQKLIEIVKNNGF